MTYNQLTQKEFEDRVRKNNPNLQIISKYKNAHSPIKYKCKICGTEGICKEANAIMRGKSGCGFCGGRKLIVGKNDFATVYPQYVIYFKNKSDATNNTYGSGKKVDMICPICGNERKYKIADIKEKGFSCPKCGDGYSYPNRFMYSLLKQKNINFYREKSFDWSDRKIYDFVFDKYIVEMDGLFHKPGASVIGNVNQQDIDTRKDLLAKNNGYIIIRINCYKSDFNYIKNNIISSPLYDILKLQDFDWNELEYSLINKNLLKISIDEFNNNKSNSISDMAKNVNLTTSKFTNLLKIGNRLGLCNYDKDKSKKGKYAKYKKRNRKQVLCIDTQEVFQSIKDAEMFYNFPKDSIGRVCRKERTQTHNLHFCFC